MREIKFKAKRLDNGEWVKGDLAHSLDGGLNILGFTRENGVDGYSGVHLIDPKTVCQFTGMKDSEGNEIWEGDIISSPHFERVATVKWDDSLCGFKCSDVTGNINFIFEAIANCSEWSIIGNKFDKEK